MESRRRKLPPRLYCLSKAKKWMWRLSLFYVLKVFFKIRRAYKIRHFHRGWNISLVYFLSHFAPKSSRNEEMKEMIIFLLSSEWGKFSISLRNALFGAGKKASTWIYWPRVESKRSERLKRPRGILKRPLSNFDEKRKEKIFGRQAGEEKVEKSVSEKKVDDEKRKMTLREKDENERNRIRKKVKTWKLLFDYWWCLLLCLLLLRAGNDIFATVKKSFFFFPIFLLFLSSLFIASSRLQLHFQTRIKNFKAGAFRNTDLWVILFSSFRWKNVKKNLKCAPKISCFGQSKAISNRSGER